MTRAAAASASANMARQRAAVAARVSAGQRTRSARPAAAGRRRIPPWPAGRARSRRARPTDGLPATSTGRRSSTRRPARCRAPRRSRPPRPAAGCSGEDHAGDQGDALRQQAAETLPGQQYGGQMEAQIEEMVAERVAFAEHVIQPEGEIGERAGLRGRPDIQPSARRIAGRDRRKWHNRQSESPNRAKHQKQPEQRQARIRRALMTKTSLRETAQDRSRTQGADRRNPGAAGAHVPRRHLRADRIAIPGNCWWRRSFRRSAPISGSTR